MMNPLDRLWRLVLTAATLATGNFLHLADFWMGN